MGWKILGLVSSGLFVILLAVISALVLALHNSGTVEAAATTPPIVATPVGRFVGVVKASATYGDSFVSYRSIPFAKPPIGELRFKRPQPMEVLESDQIVNREQYQKSCWSVTKSSTDPSYGEDCLYLNIYVPGSGEASHGTNKFPVMIWIHGGGFVAGSTFPEPEKIVVKGNVIVVTINFRLGVFGFLTTQDDALPSNNGLHDQAMALEWVQKHIQYFNGDNSSITIFGESSGAISAALHTLSPISSSFFNKVILQSGGAASLISREAELRSLEFANAVGCQDKITTLLAECLRNVSVEIILKFSKPSSFQIPLAQQQIDFIWMPTVDGVFIPDEPLKLLSNTTYLNKVGAFRKDFLIGVLNDEGGLIPNNFLNNIPLSQVLNPKFVEDLTSYLLFGRYGDNNDMFMKLKKEVYTFYTGSPELNTALLPHNVLDLSGDLTFVVPAVETALAFSRCQQSNVSSCLVNWSGLRQTNCSKTTSKTFLYLFDYCPQKDPCTAPCMVHGDDVGYEFSRTTLPDPVEQLLSDTFVDILTTFAKNSNPGTVVSSGWPSFDAASQNYLRLDVSPSVRQFLYNYRTSFWLNRVPNILVENVRP